MVKIFSSCFFYPRIFDIKIIFNKLIIYTMIDYEYPEIVDIPNPEIPGEVDHRSFNHLAMLYVNLAKECYETLGIDFEKTDTKLDYKNRLIANPLAFGGGLGGGGEGVVSGGTLFTGTASQQKYVDMSVVLNPSTYEYLLEGSAKGTRLVAGNYMGKCTSGPQGWFNKGFAAKGTKTRLGLWWTRTNGVVTGTHLGELGFVLVASYTDKASANACPQKQPGDIMTMYTGTAAHQHAVMWTGHDWRSDCIQPNGPICYGHITGAELWRFDDNRFEQLGLH